MSVIVLSAVRIAPKVEGGMRVWYNKRIDESGEHDDAPLTPKEEAALMEVARAQEELRQERLAHQGTWNWMRRHEEMLKTVCAVLDDPCSDCPKYEVCTAECHVIDVLREVLR